MMWFTVTPGHVIHYLNLISFFFEMNEYNMLQFSSPGSGFGEDLVAVTINLGSVGCHPVAVSDTEITCVVGEHSAGSFPVHVHVDSLGFADSSVEFGFLLSVDSISRTSGECENY